MLVGRALGVEHEEEGRGGRLATQVGGDRHFGTSVLRQWCHHHHHMTFSCRRRCCITQLGRGVLLGLTQRVR